MFLKGLTSFVGSFMDEKKKKKGFELDAVADVQNMSYRKRRKLAMKRSKNDAKQKREDEKTEKRMMEFGLKMSTMGASEVDDRERKLEHAVSKSVVKDISFEDQIQMALERSMRSSRVMRAQSCENERKEGEDNYEVSNSTRSDYNPNDSAESESSCTNNPVNIRSEEMVECANETVLNEDHQNTEVETAEILEVIPTTESEYQLKKEDKGDDSVFLAVIAEESQDDTFIDLENLENHHECNFESVEEEVEGEEPKKTESRTVKKEILRRNSLKIRIEIKCPNGGWRRGTVVERIKFKGCYKPHIKINFDDGCEYEGEYRKSTYLPNGSGRICDPLGSDYEGEFLDGVPHGKGRLIFQEGVGGFDGTWKNGQIHGHGEQHSSGGYRFKGLWERGRCEKGTTFLPDGKRFVGKYQDGMLVGKVKFYYISKKDNLVYTRRLVFDSDGNVRERGPEKNANSGTVPSDEDRDNETFVVNRICSRGGLWLRLASDRLKGEKKVVLIAVEKSPFALQFASKELRDDREIVLAAVRYGRTLEFASERLRNDREIVMKAILNDGTALEFASEEFREDRRVVTKAVEQDGVQAIQFSAEYLRKDLKLLRKAARQSYFSGQGRLSMKYVANHLLNYAKIYSIESQNIFGEILNILGDLQRSDQERKPRNWSQIVFLPYRSQLKKILSSSMDLEGRGAFSYPSSYEKENLEKSKKFHVPSFSSDQTKLIRKMIEEEYQLRDLEEKLKQVKLNDIRILRPLGYGVFGLTFLCEVKNIDIPIVMKIFKKLNSSEDDVKREYLRLPKHHPNLVKILGLTGGDEDVELRKYPGYPWGLKTNDEEEFLNQVIFMKYHQQDLFSYKKRRKENGENLSVLEVTKILIGILEGSKELHDNMIVHRDLHPGNVFVDPVNGRVCIGDFGLCLNLNNISREKRKGFKVHKKAPGVHCDNIHPYSGYYCLDPGGNRKYLPPEVLDYHDIGCGQYVDYGKCDVYSIGNIGCYLMGFTVENGEIETSEEYENDLLLQKEMYEEFQKRIGHFTPNNERRRGDFSFAGPD